MRGFIFCVLLIFPPTFVNKRHTTEAAILISQLLFYCFLFYCCYFTIFIFTVLMFLFLLSGLVNLKIGHNSFNIHTLRVPLRIQSPPANLSLAFILSLAAISQLLKMTFRKRDPELVTLHFLSAAGQPKTRQYRVSKRVEFVEALQVGEAGSQSAKSSMG